MKLSAIQLAMISVGVIILVAVILLFTGVIPGLRNDNAGNNIAGQLSVWGVFDGERAIIDTLVASFNQTYPNIKVSYRRLDERTYEQDLLNALAAGNGPDIFMVKNTWLIKHADKLTPMPTENLPAQTLSLFPDVVAKDFASASGVYALPLYMDTMALMYNKTMLDNAGIAQPPRTWEELESILPKLTRFNSTGQIIKAGAAIGSGSRNINESTSLLSSILLQSGTQMVSPNWQSANFSGGNGPAALKFYTHFAQPSDKSYTWEPTFHYSIDAFSEESVAMIFNFQYQIKNIKAKNPFLNFAVAPMPQFKDAPIENQINYASYFGLGVSNKSKNQRIAWDFVLNSTTNQEASAAFLTAADRAPALRSLISATLNDPELGVFSRQALTSASWPQIDAGKIDAIFSNMVDTVNFGQFSYGAAIRQAELQVTSLMTRQ